MLERAMNTRIVIDIFHTLLNPFRSVLLQSRSPCFDHVSPTPIQGAVHNSPSPAYITSASIQGSQDEHRNSPQEPCNKEQKLLHPRTQPQSLWHWQQCPLHAESVLFSSTEGEHHLREEQVTAKTPRAFNWQHWGVSSAGQTALEP